MSDSSLTPLTTTSDSEKEKWEKDCSQLETDYEHFIKTSWKIGYNLRQCEKGGKVKSLFSRKKIRREIHVGSNEVMPMRMGFFRALKRLIAGLRAIRSSPNKKEIRGIEKTLRTLVAILDTIDIQLQNYDQSYHFHFLIKLLDHLNEMDVEYRKNFNNKNFLQKRAFLFDSLSEEFRSILRECVEELETFADLARQNYLREKQSSTTNKFDILTGATLLSSVTATVIQTQFGLTDLQTDFSSSVALVMWFASLGFSMVASACSIYQGIQHFIFPFLQTKPPPNDPEATEHTKVSRTKFLSPVTYKELSNTISHISLFLSVLTFHFGLLTFMRWLVLHNALSSFGQVESMAIFGLYYALLLFAPILAISNPFPAYRSAQSLPRFWPFLNIAWIVCREIRAADAVIEINLQYVFSSKTYKHSRSRPRFLLRYHESMKSFTRAVLRMDSRYRAMGEDDPEAGKLENVSEWKVSQNPTTNAEEAKKRFRSVIRNSISSRRAVAEFDKFCSLCEEERYLREWDDEAVEVWAKRVYWGLDDIIDAFVKDFMPVYKRWYITDDVVRSKRRKSRKNNSRMSREDLELSSLFADAQADPPIESGEGVEENQIQGDVYAVDTSAHSSHQSNNHSTAP